MLVPKSLPENSNSFTMPSPSLHDTAFDMEYATRESRETTFAPPTKRSKSGWPHKTPAPADLSKAGFYFKPTPRSNDNTACFLCDRQLDGWEPEDDPIREHLKHAESCGWAVVMSIEAENEYDTSTMEDPTGQRLLDARKATFDIGWPHESKRGWTCKTEKMVEAGWYFAPTAGSEDYVSCSYCKLSLDGWEPKDNPFEEHYSRSPGCPFFVFAGTTAPSKRAKAKKGRASRASRVSRTSKVSSRLSTQSNITLQSEAPTIPDLDESIDTSTVSIMSTASTATTKGKRKATTSKSKTAKSKRAKTAKIEKTETEPMTEVEMSQETTANSVAYPSLQEERREEPYRTEQATIDEIIIEDTQQPLSPEQATGPPKMPSPRIPAMVESPIPKQSQSMKRRSSQRRSIPERHIEPVTTPPRSSPSQPSDVENAPPSTRPESVRPPVISPGTVPPKWDAVDVEMIFESTSGTTAIEKDLSDHEKQMTVQEWVKHIAAKAENELRAEGERVVGIFEKEGQRALAVLESITCI